MIGVCVLMWPCVCVLCVYVYEYVFVFHVYREKECGLLGGRAADIAVGRPRGGQIWLLTLVWERTRAIGRVIIFCSAPKDREYIETWIGTRRDGSRAGDIVLLRSPFAPSLSPS